jgi:SAM-dependent methyltransferase
MQNKIIIDLGGGRRKYPSSVGIDIVKLEGVDIVADLNKCIPLKDNSVDMLVSFHFLEHVNDFIYIVEEIHRVVKPNGIINIRVPYFNCFDAFTDPTHKNFFTERAFDYFSDEIYFNYYSKAKFKILKKELLLNPALRNKILSLFLPTKVLKGIFDVYNQVEFELSVVK